MARTKQDKRLDTRSVRLDLPRRREPYWRSISEGLAIGYRHGSKGGTWIAKHYTPTRGRRFKALGTADDFADADHVHVLSFADAQELARAWFTELAKEDAGERVTGIVTVKQAVDGYVEYLKAEKKSGDDTERRLKRHVLAKPLAARSIAALTKTEIEQWRNGMVRASDDPEAIRKSRDSANRVLTMLKAALNRAFNDEANHIPSDKAWRTVKPFKGVGRSRKLALDAAQRQRLINSTSGAFRKLVIATLYTGSRPAPGEIAQARVRDFHADLGVISITDSKTGHRDVPLTDEAVTWFKSAAAGKHPDDLLLPKDDDTAWGYNHQLRPMREARKRAKLPKGTTLYTLRHTFASEHLMRGTDLKSLADVMGTSIKMLEEHYGHILASHKRKLVEAAGFGLGLPKPRGRDAPRSGQVSSLDHYRRVRSRTAATE